MLARAAHEENGLGNELSAESRANRGRPHESTHHSRFSGALLRLEENGVPSVTVLILTSHIGVWELYKSTCQQMLLSRYHRMLEKDKIMV
jgi:hypothetical protein